MNCRYYEVEDFAEQGVLGCCTTVGATVIAVATTVMKVYPVLGNVTVKVIFVPGHCSLVSIGDIDCAKVVADNKV